MNTETENQPTPSEPTTAPEPPIDYAAFRKLHFEHGKTDRIKAYCGTIAALSEHQSSFVPDGYNKSPLDKMIDLLLAVSAAEYFPQPGQ